MRICPPLSALDQLSWKLVLWKTRIKVSDLSHDIMSPRDQESCEFVGGSLSTQVTTMLSSMLTYLVEVEIQYFHFFMQHHMTLQLKDISHHSGKFDVYRSCGKRKYNASFCHMTSYDHMIQRTRNLLSGSPSS